MSPLASAATKARWIRSRLCGSERRRFAQKRRGRERVVLGFGDARGKIVAGRAFADLEGRGDRDHDFSRQSGGGKTEGEGKARANERVFSGAGGSESHEIDFLTRAAGCAPPMIGPEEDGVFAPSGQGRLKRFQYPGQGRASARNGSARPEEIRSTPVSATSRRPPRWMPPEASAFIRPPMIATASRNCAGLILSSSTASAPSWQHFAQLVERIDLDLDLDQMADEILRRAQGGGDAARDRDMVVLDQHGVIEAEAMVDAAAAAHGIFLEGAQAGRGLPGAADFRLGMGDGLRVMRGQGRDAAQAAEKIQRDAFGGQDAPAPGLRSAPAPRRGRTNRRPRSQRLEAHGGIDQLETPSRARSRPASTPGFLRAAITAVAWAEAGMVACEVMSPARPKSSASAARTASSTRSGLSWGRFMRACVHVGRNTAALRQPQAPHRSVMKERCACAGSAAGNRCGNGRRGFRAAGKRRRRRAGRPRSGCAGRDSRSPARLSAQDVQGAQSRAQAGRVAQHADMAGHDPAHLGRAASASRRASFAARKSRDCGGGQRRAGAERDVARRRGRRTPPLPAANWRPGDWRHAGRSRRLRPPPTGRAARCGRARRSTMPPMW